MAWHITRLDGNMASPRHSDAELGRDGELADPGLKEDHAGIHSKHTHTAVCTYIAHIHSTQQCAIHVCCVRFALCMCAMYVCCLWFPCMCARYMSATKQHTCRWSTHVVIHHELVFSQQQCGDYMNMHSKTLHVSPKTVNSVHTYIHRAGSW